MKYAEKGACFDEPMGPEDFGGTDEESHFMAQTSAKDLTLGRRVAASAFEEPAYTEEDTAKLKAAVFRRSGPGCLTPAAGTPIPDLHTTQPAPLPLHLLTMTAAFLAIADERERQDRLKAAGKFTLMCADAEITHIECFAVLAEEFGEVAHEVNEAIGGHRLLNKAKLTTELIQTAAVIVAWLEKLQMENGGILP